MASNRYIRINTSNERSAVITTALYKHVRERRKIEKPPGVSSVGFSSDG